jgi:hypothetical protein
MKNEHLTLLTNIILSGEPLPLSWVVANQNEWDRHWKESKDPAIMMRIAGHVVTREKLVFVVAQIAKPILKYEPLPRRSRQVVAAAEEWSEGTRTISEAWESYYANSVRSDNLYYIMSSASRSAYNAAKAASDAAYKFAQILTLNEGSPTDESMDASRQKARRKIANIIRKNIRITVADLVLAGKHGWNPP